MRNVRSDTCTTSAPATARIPATISSRRVASFVRDDRVPQMAGAEAVVDAVGAHPETQLSGLVLNARGHERFAATSLDRLNCTLAATDAFNRRNGNASLEDSLARVEEIAGAE